MKGYDSRADAAQLFLDGADLFAEMQANGIRVDVKYYKTQLKKQKKKRKRIAKRLLENTEIKKWKYREGNDFNIDSNPQLSNFLYGYLGEESGEDGERSVKEEVLADMDYPFIDDLILYRKSKRAIDKMSEILREEVDGFVHPSYNLAFVTSYRSSCNGPNLHSVDYRDKINAELIRSGIFPRPGREFGEIDYKGSEIKAATCYHKDKRMIRYVCNPKLDMHRDMAMRCYMLKKKQMTDDIRYCGKNKFVFPQFYGDWYKTCAKALWNAIRKMELETRKGTPLKKWLKKKGIKNLGKFEDHIQEVEYYFWNELFHEYNEWKKELYQSYLNHGYVDMYTGFRCYEFMKKNEAINRAIQGTAFHWLLWSLIQLRKEMKKRKMETLLVCQIHDSAELDIVPSERDEILGLAKEIMTEWIREHWEWIIVPLEIEVEIAPKGEPWWKKKEVKI